MTSVLLPAIGKAVASYGAQAVGNAFNQFASGKMGETIGGHNEQASQDHREAARRLNVDPNVYAQVAADVNNRGQSSGASQSRSDAAFNNQLAQSNNRADLTNQMAATDQAIAYRQAEQLANAYGSAQQAQARASNDVYSAAMNRRAQNYGVNL
jgi:hypothetical protein